MGVRSYFHTIAFQVTIETGTANTEDLGGTQTIAIAQLKNLLDVNLPDFVETQWTPLFGAGGHAECDAVDFPGGRECR